ncbi:MAG: hypothetical protein AAGA75_10385 [Cyanobacteria bacterium P01_E01_bin.6]
MNIPIPQYVPGHDKLNPQNPVTASQRSLQDLKVTLNDGYWLLNPSM